MLFLIYSRDICRARLDTFTFSYINDICIRASATLIPKLRQILKKLQKRYYKKPNKALLSLILRKQSSFTLAARKSLPTKMRKSRIIRPIVVTPYIRVTYSQSLGCSFFYF
jgi:hypothetical protein